MKPALALLVLLTGCAVPQYRTDLVPYSNPLVQREQAIAICEPEARMAGSQAYSNAYAANAPAPAAPNYNCQTFGAMTNCNAQPGYVSPYAGLGQVLLAGSAQRSTYDAVLTSCLARLGWGTQRTCIANCR